MQVARKVQYSEQIGL